MDNAYYKKYIDTMYTGLNKSIFFTHNKNQNPIVFFKEIKLFPILHPNSKTEKILLIPLNIFLKKISLFF